MGSDCISFLITAYRFTSFYEAFISFAASMKLQLIISTMCYFLFSSSIWRHGCGL